MTPGMSVFRERKPLRVAPATRDLGGGGDGDPDVGTRVLHRQHGRAPVQPLRRVVAGLPTAPSAAQGGSGRRSCVGTLETHGSVTAWLRPVPGACAAAGNVSSIPGGSAPGKASG